MNSYQLQEIDVACDHSLGHTVWKQTSVCFPSLPSNKVFSKIVHKALVIFLGEHNSLAYSLTVFLEHWNGAVTNPENDSL